MPATPQNETESKNEPSKESDGFSRPLQIPTDRTTLGEWMRDAAELVKKNKSDPSSQAQDSGTSSDDGVDDSEEGWDE